MNNIELFSRDKGGIPWYWCYFHGKCEDHVNNQVNQNEEEYWCAPDLISGNISCENLEPGIYEVSVYDAPAKCFLWEFRDSLEQPTKHTKRALVVFESDIHSYEYAKKCYEERKDHV